MKGGPRQFSAGMSLVGSPIRSPGGSGEEERGGRGPAGRNSKEKHVERKGPGPRAGKKGKQVLVPFVVGTPLSSVASRVRPRRQMRQKYQVGCSGCMAQEAPCSLRTTAVQKVPKAGRMRSRPAEMSTSTRGAEARGQDDRGRRWVSAGEGTIGLACASEASFCPTQSSSGPRLRIDILKLTRANRVPVPGRRRATTQSTLACRRDCGRRSAVSCRPNDALHVSHPGFWPARRIPPLASAPLQPLLCEVFATDAVSLGRESSSVASWTYVGDPVNARPDSVSPSAAHLLVCPSAHPPIPSPHPAQVTNPTSHAGLWKQNGSGAPARRLVASLLRRTAQQATHCGIYLVQDDAVPPSCWSKTRPAGAASTLNSALAGTAYMSAWRDAWIRPPSPFPICPGTPPSSQSSQSSCLSQSKRRLKLEVLYTFRLKESTREPAALPPTRSLVWPTVPSRRPFCRCRGRLRDTSQLRSSPLPWIPLGFF